MIEKLIKYPVRYDPLGQIIFDANTNHIADVRSWGRISYMENAEEKHDYMGQFIAEAINEKLRSLPTSPDQGDNRERNE